MAALQERSLTSRRMNLKSVGELRNLGKKCGFLGLQFFMWCCGVLCSTFSAQAQSQFLILRDFLHPNIAQN